MCPRNLTWVGPHNPWLNVALAAALAAVAYLVGQAASQQLVPGIVNSFREGLQQQLGAGYAPPAFLQPPADFLSESGMVPQVLWAYVSALMLGLGVAVVARWLGGRLVARWMVLSLFLLVVHTLNTAIEALIFIELNGQAHSVVGGLLPCSLAALVVVLMIQPVPGALAGLAGAFGNGTFAWRLLAAWLAFPLSYLTFGILIAPLVIESYSQADSLLEVPRISTILATQAVRSMFYLGATLAVIERWTGTRWQMWIALSWSHWALVGLAGLVLPNDILEPRLRLVHALEIGADSFMYIGLVVLVLGSRSALRTSALKAPDGSTGGREPTYPQGDVQRRTA